MTTRKSVSFLSTVPVALTVLIASILCAKAGEAVTMKVPFDFQAAGTHFAPGEYLLSMDNAMAGSVTIQSADRTQRAVLLTRKSILASAQSAPVVMFRAYGESRFLSAIQGTNASQRWEIIPPADETALAHTSEQPVVASLSGSGPAVN